jgi:hypothetical protein
MCADITMCIGRDCPKKDTCYRFAAPPTWQRQSYFSEVPYDGEDCNYYWKLEEHDENRTGHRDKPST